MRGSGTTRARARAAALLLCLGCGGAEEVPLAPKTVFVNPISLSIRGPDRDPFIVIGDSLVFHAEAKYPVGSVIDPPELQWTAVWGAIVSLTPRSGVVPVDSSPIIVEDAHLLLFDDGSAFLPNMLLRSRDSLPAVLLGFKLVIPGYFPLRYCGTSAAEVVGAESRPLIFASYGDWELSYIGPFPVPTSAPAVVLLYVRDGSGRPFEVLVPLAFTTDPRPMIDSTSRSAPWSGC